MSTLLDTPGQHPQHLDQHTRIEQFVRRFPAYGSPSVRSMVRSFIAQHIAAHGCLPAGRRPLQMGDNNSGFLGQTIDFSQL